MADAKKKGWDMTSTHGMESGTDWLLKKADAMVVIAIRPDDFAIAAHPLLAPKDVMGLLDNRAPEISAQLEKTREELRARVAAKKVKR